MKGQLFIILAASITNILLNNSLKKVATDSNENILNAITSGKIILPFLIGMVSLFLLLTVYCSGLNLARGILLMGATSIICGTLFGVFCGKGSLSNIEWLIFSAILILYIFKWIAQLKVGNSI